VKREVIRRGLIDLRKYLFIIFFVFMVVSASGCVSQVNQTGNQTPAKTYAQNGISFNYANNWFEVQNQAPDTIVAVGDPKTADSQTGDVKTSVVIQKLDNPSGFTLRQLYDGNYALYATQNRSYQRISDGNLTLSGTTAYENIYKVDSNGVQKQERAVWMEKNNIIYVILCVSLPENFNKEQKNFDFIINSFQVQ
jgi:PsbP-like protein